jgi:hypothetical protein
MKSLVANSRKTLETRGEYVVLANIKTGWFAVSLSTWQKRIETAKSNGREGPNIVFYRTTTNNPRDHYVIPYNVARNILTKQTITKVKKTSSPRWNLWLNDNILHVTHLSRKIDVGQYYGASLLVEGVDVPITEEVTPNEVFREGAVRTILVNAFERNRGAREACIAHYGRRCSVCRMSFAEFYGPEAADIIHVHHLTELKSIEAEYDVDPIKDLRPVCPNCHAVIHSRGKAYSIEEATLFVLNSKTARE